MSDDGIGDEWRSYAGSFGGVAAGLVAGYDLAVRHALDVEQATVNLKMVCTQDQVDAAMVEVDRLAREHGYTHLRAMREVSLAVAKGDLVFRGV